MNLSILNFYEEKIKYIFNPNESFIKWPEATEYLQFYEEVPEHTSAINFILNNLIIDGVETLDFWTVQKLGLDYLTFGGFTVEVIKTRGGGYKLNYLDISKLRYNPTKTMLGYSDNWSNYKPEVKWKKVTTSVKEDGIYIFKNPKSRYLYPTPHYASAYKSLDTMEEISEYHNNNAKNGFTPTAIINMNNGEPDEDTKRIIEKKFAEKFTGSKGQKFVISYNQSPETATTIEKLEDDNLDAKFETLQKFLRNQIIISHGITSGTLIGVVPENQGFSKTEFFESMEIFSETVIANFRRELEYGFSTLFDKDITLPTKSKGGQV